MVDRRLGRGLKAIFSESTTPKGSVQGKTLISLDSIIPNRNQPRKNFSKEALEKLANSIRKHGLLQPILVRKVDRENHEIIAGERRWRAAKQAGLTEIPVFVKEADSNQALLELALLENLQREDLDPIEKGKGFKRLQEEFGLTQEQIAEVVELDRSSVANFMRLLDLPFEVQESVSRGTITMGHARALLGMPNQNGILNLLHRIVNQGLSVRETERLVRRGGSLLVKGKPKKKAKSSRPAWVDDLEDKLRNAFSTKVQITRNRAGQGKVMIEFSSDSGLEKIIERINLYH